jgi:hypothetical protein
VRIRGLELAGHSKLDASEWAVAYRDLLIPVMDSASFDLEGLEKLPLQARKLFAVIVHQANHGPIHPKLTGTATPPEILEACGLDVGEFYELLGVLAQAGLIRISNSYPFEEIQLTPAAAAAVLPHHHDTEPLS